MAFLLAVSNREGEEALHRRDGGGGGDPPRGEAGDVGQGGLLRLQAAQGAQRRGGPGHDHGGNLIVTSYGSRKRMFGCVVVLGDGDGDIVTFSKEFVHS